MTEIGELIALLLETLGGGNESEPDCDYWRKNFKTDYSGPDSKFVTSTQIAAVDVAFRLEPRLKSGYVRITSIF